MNFLFLLTAGPRSEALHTVSALARAAGDAGHGAEVFLAGDGVAHAVRDCWASLYSSESVSYRLRLKLPEEEIGRASCRERV